MCIHVVGCAQHYVTPDHFAQCDAQCAGLQRAMQPEQDREVIRGAGRFGRMDSEQLRLIPRHSVARADKLRCFALADGRELWSQSYPVEVKRNHGMSRTVPAVTKDYVVTLGPKCHVLCAHPVTGAVYWRIDLVGQYGAKVPPWYAGQCPLIDGDRVILAPGGSALLVALALLPLAHPRVRREGLGLAGRLAPAPGRAADREREEG